jgi:hypothetical protein
MRFFFLLSLFIFNCFLVNDLVFSQSKKPDKYGLVKDEYIKLLTIDFLYYYGSTLLQPKSPDSLEKEIDLKETLLYGVTDLSSLINAFNKSELLKQTSQKAYGHYGGDPLTSDTFKLYLQLVDGQTSFFKNLKLTNSDKQSILEKSLEHFLNKQMGNHNIHHDVKTSLSSIYLGRLFSGSLPQKEIDKMSVANYIDYFNNRINTEPSMYEYIITKSFIDKLLKKEILPHSVMSEKENTSVLLLENAFNYDRYKDINLGLNELSKKNQPGFLGIDDIFKGKKKLTTLL